MGGSDWNPFGFFGGGNALYSSSTENPFGGTCITQIDTLIANHIKVTTLEAQMVTVTGRITAAEAKISSLESDTVNIKNRLRYRNMDAIWKGTSICHQNGTKQASGSCSITVDGTSYSGTCSVEVPNITNDYIWYLGVD